MLLEAFARTDPGPVRENNEDSLLIDLDSGLFVVADGMGGHASGEVASAISVETVQEILLDQHDPDETRLDRQALDDDDAIRERLRYAMNQASIRIRKAALDNPVHSGMGTTLTVLLIEDGTAHFGHVGDSRLYLLRDGRMKRLTRDHTVVQQEIDAGRLTPELARIVPHKNILTQSVGYHGPVEPDTSTRPVLDKDIFLLCSDGLTDPLDDQALTDICMRTPFEDLADELVRQAIDNGTEDNVTVIVIRVED
ncbi:MAG: serine/threonine protein phosphatase PrpC [Myxococcota bacterium]|jgi:serine/threonine protein phosphatase PrpC